MKRDRAVEVVDEPEMLAQITSSASTATSSMHAPPSRLLSREIVLKSETYSPCYSREPNRLPAHSLYRAADNCQGNMIRYNVNSGLLYVIIALWTYGYLAETINSGPV